MTPDDIRHATFDTVRKGFDPEQVHDLLARVAFLLDRRPDIDLDELDQPVVSSPDGARRGSLPPTEFAFDLDRDVGDSGVLTAEALTKTTVMRRSTAPPPPPDTAALSARLDELISAAQELIEWKQRLEESESADSAPEPTSTEPPPRTDVWGAASIPWFLHGSPVGLLHEGQEPPMPAPMQAAPPAAPGTAQGAHAGDESLAELVAATPDTRPRTPSSVLPGLDDVLAEMSNRRDRRHEMAAS